jgi:hypothetical protein
MNFEETAKKLDSLFGVLFKYEIHAFILLLTGVLLVLRGIKEEGFAVIGAALTVFKGKAGG